MSETHVKPAWYEISIGWGDEKSWFLVDRMPPEYRPLMVLPGTSHEPRKLSVEVKHRDGELCEITVQAQFSSLPRLDDVMAVVLRETHNDHHHHVRYQITSRKEGLATAGKRLPEDLDRELERLRSCVPRVEDGATP